MNLPKLRHWRTSLSFVFFLAFSSGRAPAQTTNIPARITQAVDEKNLVVLHGNVHPLARAEFDQGAAPLGFPMERMRSPGCLPSPNIAYGNMGLLSHWRLSSVR